MARLAPEFEKRARDLVALYPQPRSALLPLLHLLQEQEGWLPEDGMEHVGELVGLLPAEVLSVASFYDMFHTEPVGRYVIGLCTNVACLLDGAEELLHHAEQRLGIKHGATTPDGLFTLEEAECVAHCNKAPCLQVNYRYFGPLDGDGFDALVDDLAAGRLADVVPPHGTLLRVRREGGLRVAPERIAEERARVGAEIEARAAEAKAAQERAAAEEQAAEAERKAAEERAAAAAVQEADAEVEPRHEDAAAGDTEPQDAARVEQLERAQGGQDAEAEAKGAQPSTDVEGKKELP